MKIWMESIEPILCTQIKRRKKLQKVEFLASWALFFFLLLVTTCTYGSGGVRVVLLSNTSGNTPTGGHHESDLTSAISTTSTRYSLLLSFYLRATLLTRAFAYAVDFANARKKLGQLPPWLVLHHFGVYAIHVITALYFSQSHTKMMCCYMLAAQSTHNTWTKKYSLLLYWGNVLIGGVINSIYFSIMNIIVIDEDEVSRPSMGVCIFCLMAMVICFTGIILLVLECFNTSKNKEGKKKEQEQNSNTKTAKIDIV